MSFLHLPRETQIHLVDYEQRSSIHARYANAELPAGLPRIFTTNAPSGGVVATDDAAIRRRVNVMHASASFITGEDIEPEDKTSEIGNEAGWDPVQEPKPECIMLDDDDDDYVPPTPEEEQLSQESLYTLAERELLI